MKGKTSTKEHRTPKLAKSSANRTRSVTRHLDIEARATSLASQKLHEQKWIELLDEEELASNPTNSDSEVDSDDDFEIIDSKYHRVGRIYSPPLKKLKKCATPARSAVGFRIRIRI